MTKIHRMGWRSIRIFLQKLFKPHCEMAERTCLCIRNLNDINDEFSECVNCEWLSVMKSCYLSYGVPTFEFQNQYHFLTKMCERYKEIKIFFFKIVPKEFSNPSNSSSHISLRIICIRKNLLVCVSFILDLSPFIIINTYHNEIRRYFETEFWN